LSVVSIPSVAFVVQQFERPVGEFPGTAGQRGHPLGDGRSRSGFEFGWPTGPPAAEVPDDVPNDGLRLVVQFPEVRFVGFRILDRVENVDRGGEPSFSASIVSSTSAWRYAAESRSASRTSSSPSIGGPRPGRSVPAPMPDISAKTSAHVQG